MMSAGCSYDFTLLGHAYDLVPVATQSDAFVQAADHLSLKPTYTPVLLGTFHFIKTSCAIIFDAHQNEVVAPTQNELVGLRRGDLNLVNTVYQIRFAGSFGR